ncbi:MAG: hypothetical protein ACM3KI_11110 [Bacillota bacterium]
MKIKLLRPLWNKKRNDVMEVSEDKGQWAVNKKYAEYIPESIESIQAKVVTEYKTKVIKPEVKKRGRKSLKDAN